MLADSFSEREAALDDFPARTAGVADGTSGDEAGGDAWAEAAVSHRVTSLLLEDVRAELAGLERIAERQDTATDDLATIDARLADLEDRWRAIDERIEDLARPAWRDRFDDRLAAVEAVLEDFEPPVDLGELQTAIEETRP